MTVSVLWIAAGCIGSWAFGFLLGKVKQCSRASIAIEDDSGRVVRINTDAIVNG